MIDVNDVLAALAAVPVIAPLATSHWMQIGTAISAPNGAIRSAACDAMRSEGTPS